MFVVLSGHVAINLRDGLGHVTPVIDQGAGQSASFPAVSRWSTAMPMAMSKRS